MRLVRELDPLEIRVLGSLVEKQLSTPDAYPLTISSLVAACNQRSNREPVLDLTEGEVLASLERLRELVLVWHVTGSRSEKWEHNLDSRWDLSRPGKALVCLLFLRGEQTVGELRTRSDRLYPFPALQDVENELRRLATEAEPLVFELPRRPGQKESRWSHLAGSAPPGTETLPHPQATPPAVQERRMRELAVTPGLDSVVERLDRLEAALDALRADLAALRSRLGE